VWLYFTISARERSRQLDVLCTVKNHVTNSLTKLDVRDRTQAAIRARQLGLV